MNTGLRSKAGFTLIELMFTLGIAAAVVMVGVPSFNDAITNARATAYTNDLVLAFSLARSEAVKRGVTVSVAHKGGAPTQWEGGWDVFVDLDGDGSFYDNNIPPECETNEDCLLRVFEPLEGGFTLRSGGGAAASALVFAPSGMLSVVATTTFALCGGGYNKNTESDATRLRNIRVNNTGRARIEKPSGDHSAAGLPGGCQ
jgi:type IV fimbrial biogenesis protein FimT